MSFQSFLQSPVKPAGLIPGLLKSNNLKIHCHEKCGQCIYCSIQIYS